MEALALLASVLTLAAPGPEKTLRPPAYPLVTCDPYFSVWSMTDKLTDSWPRHWTGQTMGMCGMVRVDGKAYRWCGMAPGDVEAAEQVGVVVGRSTTEYTFTAGPVRLEVVFCTPSDGDMVGASRSVSTIFVTTQSTDRGNHTVDLYLDTSAEWTVHDPGTAVTWSRHRIAGHDAVSIGSVEQPVLATAGDSRRIDWGRLYLVAPRNQEVAVTGHATSRAAFIRTGQVALSDDLRMPRAADDDWPVLATAIDLGTGITSAATIMLAYDDGFSIELFDRKLRPLWNSDGRGIERAIGVFYPAKVEDEALRTAELRALATLDPAGQGTDLEADRRYRELINLAFRQVLAGHKIVADWDGTPLMFSKENTSNGCIATVDVIYPACPFFLYHNPEMLKAQLRPLMMYSASNRWKFPFAPHDLGTYPKANGQVYGGGERDERDQMPVEESGNMLIMLSALAKVEGNAEFSRPYEGTIEKWAEYLKANGLDPANQLCTDDFAGHLARNANLSAKTVVALGAYAQLLKALGHADKASEWETTARDYAKKWMDLAKDGDGTVLVFGKAGTWSQKYNLIWDRVLGLELFPDAVFEREMKTYLAKMQKYGLPLDSRKTYTKLDWTVWSACLTGKRSDFDAIMSHVYAYVNETPSRVPLSDWYETTDGKTMGMHTRTVVGGMWMPLLMEKMGVGLK